ncbi:hypothetical protein FP568_02315 [Pandoraea pnomenusa]|jgi:hypothetical protein|uniref:hypothetical protein n=1 Tax=Pandoraea pnomenusa TaxID=93220 RepID=UPI0011475BE8|nr:hypothetical protein [Pandoraea pnomenusa]QDH58299.1 hypothetical protein FKQ53_02640 [Pandoraea pnomenusa]QDX20202.1 hypothetical protein FP568_02315 [Pandoraea pnomenusa]
MSSTTGRTGRRAVPRDATGEISFGIDAGGPYHTIHGPAGFDGRAAGAALRDNVELRLHRCICETHAADVV